MQQIETLLKKFDRWQQRHTLTAFIYAVIKKYGEDQGGYQAVLITYYAFLSIFPLLLILTTLTQLFLNGDSVLRNHVLQGVDNYFPVIGSQLQHSVHGLRGTGLALGIGFLALLYGTRGVADAFRHAANGVWGVPLADRSGFWPALGRSFSMVAFGGLGFLLAAVITSFATLAGHSDLLRLPFILAGALIICISFMLVMKLALDRPIHRHQMWASASVVTGGLVLLQFFGGYIVTHQLRHLNGLYSTFALSLGLLFWLYLQTQLVVYAMEIDVVRSLKLWPRSLLSNTAAAKLRQER